MKCLTFCLISLIPEVCCVVSPGGVMIVVSCVVVSPGGVMMVVSCVVVSPGGVMMVVSCGLLLQAISSPV